MSLRESLGWARIPARPWHLDPARVIVLQAFVGTLAAFMLLTALDAIQAHHSFLAPIFARLLFADDAAALLWMAAVTLLLVPLAGSRRGQALARPIRAAARWIAARPWHGALGVTALAGAGAIAVYHTHPLSMDEYAVAFQARIFAAGRLTGQIPPEWLDRVIAPGFQNQFILVARGTGEVASAYWPGFALLMAPFAALGVPWLLNPVIGGVTLVLFMGLARRIAGDEECAGWAGLLLCASPVFFADALSYYAMGALLLFNLLYAVLLLEPVPRRLFAAGVAGSLAATLHNPLPHLLFALPWLIWLGRGAGGARRVLWLGLGYVPLIVVLGGGWLMLRWSLAAPASAAAQDGAMWAQLATLAAVFTLPSADILAMRIAALVKVWAWALPGLLVLAALGCRTTRDCVPLRLLVASLMTTFLGYFLVPLDQGHGWGYRYLHGAFFALPLLGAVALRTDPRGARRDAAALLVAAGLLVMVPLRLVQMEDFIAGYLAQRPSVPAGARAVVMIDPGGFYTTDLVQNDPCLRGPLITLLSRGRQRDEAFMARYFPGSEPLPAERYGRVWRLP